jgi:hypothetical protein
MSYDELKRAARASHTRLENIEMSGLGAKILCIFAKIYVYEDANSKLKPIALTNINKAHHAQAYVFVTIPPPAPSEGVWGVWSAKIASYLSPVYTSNGHPITIIDNTKMREMISRGLIYSRNVAGITEYWYLVQDLDILSGYNGAMYDPVIHGEGVSANAENGDDVARGYIMLVHTDEERMRFILVTGDIIPSKGGNKCSLKPKSNKRKKKQNKHNSRRRSKIRKRNTRN